MKPEDAKIAVIGLGYVGLPLAVAFGRLLPTTGFDIKPSRIAELQEGQDSTRELEASEMAEAGQLTFSGDPETIRDCNVYIVTVPTPVDRGKQPDLQPLRMASATIGPCLSEGDIVIYESTVYPGATEEVCVPILEETSGLEFNRDFFAAYSPERINPGDREHKLRDIVKVTSGSTPDTADFVDRLYRMVVSAGTHRASSIKVAEAGKVIENTQRDLNIALINELCIIFNRLGIDTEEVLAAAGSKWNFQPYRPGMVGGHCISVDPYYLTYKAQEVGYHPEVILSGRRINDGMGAYIANRLVRQMTRERIHVVDSRILVLGLTFKENCPDLRNTRVIDMISTLRHLNAHVDVHDPWANPEEAQSEYALELSDTPRPGTYDAVVVAVAHDEFRQMGPEGVRALAKSKSVIFDIKYLFPQSEGFHRL